MRHARGGMILGPFGSAGRPAGLPIPRTQGGGYAIDAPTDVAAVTPITDPPSFDVGWNPAGDNPPQTGDYVQRSFDGGSWVSADAALDVADISASSFEFTGTSPLGAGSHSVRFRFYRSDSEVSAPTASLAFITGQPDAPSVSVSPDPTSNPASATLTLVSGQTPSSRNHAVDDVPQYRVDGGSWTSLDPLDAGDISTGSVAFNLPTLSEASHTLEGRIYRPGDGVYSEASTADNFTVTTASPPSDAGEGYIPTYASATYDLSIDAGSAGSGDIYLFLATGHAANRATAVVFDPASENVSGSLVAEDAGSGACWQLWKIASVSGGGAKTFRVTRPLGGGSAYSSSNAAVYRQNGDASTAGTVQKATPAYKTAGQTLTLASAAFSSDWSFGVAAAQGAAQSLSLARADAESPVDSRTFDDSDTKPEILIEVFNLGGTTNYTLTNTGGAGFCAVGMIPFTYD